jgi:hypothetical protein
MTPEQAEQILRSRVSPRYYEVGDRMVEAIPELSAVFEDYVADWKAPGAPGAINLTDELLVPFVEELLEDESRVGVLQRALNFIEDLASDPESEIREVAQETVNCLAPNRKFLEAVPLMGAKTQQLLERSGGSLP